MKLLIAEKWQKSDTKLLENSSTAVLCWPQRKGDSTMTLGEKIASARKEKGMTQEMLAEQLGVTRQAVARWETGESFARHSQPVYAAAAAGNSVGSSGYGSD